MLSDVVQVLLQGVYRWNDGSYADFFFWRQQFFADCSPRRYTRPNDKDNVAIQDCIVIRNTVNSNNCQDNGWDDVSCFNSADANDMDFVCERRPTC